MKQRLNEKLPTLAGLLTSDALSPGDIATLRRIEPDEVLPPIVWRLMQGWEFENERQERAFAVLLALMALARLSGTGQPIGRALSAPSGESAYAEARFVRLLRARGVQQVTHEARQAVRWCLSQGRAIDFRGRDGFGAFIWAAVLEYESDAERHAHVIARDYFHRAENGATQTESA